MVGHVRNPGLKSLPQGARVADALALADPREDADTQALNAAEKLVDGTQIVVSAGQTGPAAAGNPTSRVVTGDGGGPATGGTGAARPVSVATATVRQLTAVPGIGDKTAQAIIAYRDTSGPVTDIGQLTAVRGIGDATVARLSEYLVP